jgi:predicted DNA-binding protein
LRSNALCRHVPRMTKRIQDEQLVIRVAPVLKAEVRALAEAEGRTASDYIKRVLIGHVIERTAAPLAEREAA